MYPDAKAVFESGRGWVVYSLLYRGDNEHVLGQGNSETEAWADAEERVRKDG